MSTRDELQVCLWLSAVLRSPGIRRQQIISLMEQFSSLEDLIGLYSRKIDRKNEVDEQYNLARQKQIKAISWLDDDYPRRLRQISGFPLVLYWCGINPVQMQEAAWLTVVGTRRPSTYGRTVTRNIVAPVVRRGGVIVSGMARGIDSEAHRTALNNDSMTVAVLGNGPDIVYPPDNKELYARIIRNGTVLSEHPPGVPPRKQHFPARNRILSGLADCVAVMEASTDSGTMITAGFAADQGREVFAVPGNIYSPGSGGCNQLIRDGAGILLAADDLYPHLPLSGSQVSLADLNSCQPVSGEKQLLSKKPARVLAGGELTLSQLAGELEMTLPEAAALLTRLETAGLVVYERGRYSLTDAGISCI